jgi:hypothetical protein
MLLLLLAVVLVAMFAEDALVRAHYAAQLRRLRRLPVTPIREVVDGTRVRIEGAVTLDGPPLRTPFGGQPCAAYRATIRFYRRGWRRRIVRAERTEALVVRDRQGGKVRVRAPACWLVEPEMTLRLGASFIAASRRICRFLRDHGLVPHPSLAGAAYAEHLSEAALRPDDEVTLVGVAHWAPDDSPDAASPTAGYRSAPSVLVMTASNDCALFLIKK